MGKMWSIGFATGIILTISICFAFHIIPESTVKIVGESLRGILGQFKS